jgi:hypothetical protein
MSGRDLLLDYAFPIQAIENLAQPSTAYLNRVCVVAKPKTGQEANVGTIYQCLSMIDVAVRTNNTNAQQLFNAGLTQVYILLANDLDLATFFATENRFFTTLISDDFNKNDITANQAQGVFTVSDYTHFTQSGIDTITINGVVLTAQTGAVVAGEATFQAATSNNATANSIASQINAHATLKNVVIATVVDNVITVKAKEGGSAGNLITAIYTNNGGTAGGAWTGVVSGKLSGGDGLFLGTWNGVVGVSSDDVAFLEAQAVISKRTAFFGNATNGAKSMFFAFGKLLSSATWKNQQYVEMPVNDGIDTIAEALNLYNSRISFVLNSIQYGNRLALFTNNRKAIVAPYLSELFQIMMQGWGVGYIALNQPSYTILQASLLEDYLAGEADKTFVQTNLIESVSVQISLVENNFTANGTLQIAEPKALWRVNSVLTETA